MANAVQSTHEDKSGGKASAFISKHGEIWKFIKFTFTGLSTSILELGIYMLLLKLVFAPMNGDVVDNAFLNFLGIEYAGYMWSYFISTIIGYAAAFVMNRKFTFHADANPTASVIMYTIMVVFTIIVNTWLGSVLSGLLVQNGWDNDLGNIIVKIIVMTIPTLWTYPLNRFVIHRKKKTVTHNSQMHS